MERGRAGGTARPGPAGAGALRPRGGNRRTFGDLMMGLAGSGAPIWPGAGRCVRNVIQAPSRRSAKASATLEERSPRGGDSTGHRVSTGLRLPFRPLRPTPRRARSARCAPAEDENMTAHPRCASGRRRKGRGTAPRSTARKRSAPKAARMYGPSAPGLSPSASPTEITDGLQNIFRRMPRLPGLGNPIEAAFGVKGKGGEGSGHTVPLGRRHT